MVHQSVFRLRCRGKNGMQWSVGLQVNSIESSSLPRPSLSIVWRGRGAGKEQSQLFGIGTEPATQIDPKKYFKNQVHDYVMKT